MERVTERITEKTDEGIWVKESPGDSALKTLYRYYGAEPLPDYSNCDEGYLGMEKLVQYETAEEDGKLVVLPCGIGDIFYVLLPVCDWIVPCIVDEIKLRHNVKFHLVSAHEMIGYTEWHSTKDIGKTIFRTKGMQIRLRRKGEQPSAR